MNNLEKTYEEYFSDKLKELIELNKYLEFKEFLLYFKYELKNN